MNHSSVEEVAEILGQVPLFKGLNRGLVRRLAERTAVRSYEPGDVIVKEGDTSMSFYVILSGSVRILRELDDHTQLDVRHSVKGGFFGEMGLIDDLPRSATVEALDATRCALLAKWDFQEGMRQDPDIALALIKSLNARIRELDSRLAGVGAAH